MAETTEQYRTRINQLETSILTEPYIKEMRSDISEGIGKTGNRQADIEIRQSTIEEDFVTVQTDASNVSPSGAEVAVARGGYATLDDRLNEKEQGTADQLTKNQSNFNARGVIATLPPAPYNACVGDGIADDLGMLNVLLTNFYPVILPMRAKFRITDTLVIGPRYRALVAAESSGNGSGSIMPVIIYDGVTNTHKAVVRLGSNAVDSEPTIDGTAVVFKDIAVNANKKAGFGVYGTYLTNESKSHDIVTINSLEYGQYYAKSWYASIKNALDLGSRGQGIAFGMPLEYLDGTSTTWTSTSPLEMNNSDISNARSMQAGKYFSEENPGTYNPAIVSMRRKGYGLGFGYGNSFDIAKYTSEQAGGASVYVLSNSQPVKLIKNGYVEKSSLNSGLDPVNAAAGYILENTSPTGGSIVLDTSFINPTTGGGIYHTGVLGRKIWLKNFYQPRFLKSLDGLTQQQLYSEVLKENVYVDCGLYNTDGADYATESIQTINTRYSFTVNILKEKLPKLLYIKAETGGSGTYVVNYADGTSNSYTYITSSTLEYVRELKGDTISITRGGSAGTVDNNVVFAIVKPKPTFY